MEMEAGVGNVEGDQRDRDGCLERMHHFGNGYGVLVCCIILYKCMYSTNCFGDGQDSISEANLRTMFPSTSWRCSFITTLAAWYIKASRNKLVTLRQGPRRNSFRDKRWIHNVPHNLSHVAWFGSTSLFDGGFNPFRHSIFTCKLR